MTSYIIEEKDWYNQKLQIYQTILTINNIPADLSEFIKRAENVKLSQFQPNNDFYKRCLYYFIKTDHCACSSPMQSCDLIHLYNLLTEKGYEILHKETKIFKQHNHKVICLIKKLM